MPPSKAQAAAVRRYESSGKRPGKQISLRVSEAEERALRQRAAAANKTLAAYIKARLFGE